MKLFYNLFLFAALIFTLLSFTNCAGGGQINIPDEVCQYGEIVCSVSNTLCAQNTIPADICYYLELSCLNLNYLCGDTLSTESRQVILNYQKQINEKLINSVLKK